MMQLAAAGVLGLGALQGGETPRKRFYKDPTGTSPATLGVIRSGNCSSSAGSAAGIRPGVPAPGISSSRRPMPSI